MPNDKALQAAYEAIAHDQERIAELRRAIDDAAATAEHWREIADRPVDAVLRDMAMDLRAALEQGGGDDGE